jgi:hypothetical protein
MFNLTGRGDLVFEGLHGFGQDVLLTPGFVPSIIQQLLNRQKRRIS